MLPGGACVTAQRYLSAPPSPVTLSLMVRPFSLRDWSLLRRLSDEGTLLHAESALTRSCQPLRGALFNMVTRGDAATFVWRAENGDSSGFVQLLLPPGQPHAQRLCRGATPVDGADAEDSSRIYEDAWFFLLDGAVAAIGQRGIHSVIAEVEETGPELPVLRQAGFAVYTRQDIWCMAGPAPSAGDNQLQLVTEADEWDVEWLYAHTVPPLIQLVEPTPPQEGQDWILREGDDLVAVVNLRDGRAATWMRLFIHPNAQARRRDCGRGDHVGPGRSPTIRSTAACRYQSWAERPATERLCPLPESGRHGAARREVNREEGRRAGRVTTADATGSPTDDAGGTARAAALPLILLRKSDHRRSRLPLVWV